MGLHEAQSVSDVVARAGCGREKEQLGYSVDSSKSTGCGSGVLAREPPTNLL